MCLNNYKKRFLNWLIYLWPLTRPSLFDVYYTYEDVSFCDWYGRLSRLTAIVKRNHKTFRYVCQQDFRLSWLSIWITEWTECQASVMNHARMCQNHARMSPEIWYRTIYVNSGIKLKLASESFDIFLKKIYNNHLIRRNMLQQHLLFSQYIKDVCY